MEIQPVPVNTPNPIVLASAVEPESLHPGTHKEPICFYCKQLRSSCKDRNHWNRKLATEHLKVDSGLSGPDGKHLVLVSCVPGDEAFERIQDAELEKQIGRVSPEGQSPDPEDSNLHSTLDFHWLESAKWDAVDRLEQNFILSYIRGCQDIELAVRWSFAFPKYMQRMLLAEWRIKHPETQTLYDKIELAAIIKREFLTVTCSKCNQPFSLDLTIFGNASIELPAFTCADCLGRFTKEFEPRSRLRKWPRCYRDKSKSSRTLPAKKRRTKIDQVVWSFDVYARLVLAAGGYTPVLPQLPTICSEEVVYPLLQKKEAADFCLAPTQLNNFHNPEDSHVSA